MFWDGVPNCGDQTTSKFDFYAFINEISEEEEGLQSSVDNYEEKSTLPTAEICPSATAVDADLSATQQTRRTLSRVPARSGTAEPKSPQQVPAKLRSSSAKQRSVEMTAPRRYTDHQVEVLRISSPSSMKIRVFVKNRIADQRSDCSTMFTASTQRRRSQPSGNSRSRTPDLVAAARTHRQRLCAHNHSLGQRRLPPPSKAFTRSAVMVRSVIPARGRCYADMSRRGAHRTALALIPVGIDELHTTYDHVKKHWLTSEKIHISHGAPDTKIRPMCAAHRWITARKQRRRRTPSTPPIENVHNIAVHVNAWMISAYLLQTLVNAQDCVVFEDWSRN